MVHSALMPSPSSVPAWIGALGGLGIGSLIATLLSLWQHHRGWVNDSKKAEYRELLDALYETVKAVSENRPNLSTMNSGPINDAVQKLARIFEDRIFITDSLRKSSAYQDWQDMKKLIYYDPELQSLTPTELRYSTNNLFQREDKLRKKILGLAKKDFKWFGG